MTTVWKPQGDLALNTINTQQKALNQFLLNTAIKDIIIDLSDVQRSDSAGLAFMIEAVRLVHAGHRTIYFQSVPEQIIAMMRFCHVWSLFKEEKWIN